MNELVKRGYGGDATLSVEYVMRRYGVSKISIRNKNFQKQAIVRMLDDCVNNFALYNFTQEEMKKGSNVWMYFFEHHNPKITSGLKLFLPVNSKFMLIDILIYF